MLEVSRRVPIAPRTTSDSALANTPIWNKKGVQVAQELGGRYLLRYLRSHQIGLYLGGSSDRHWVTPTPYAPEETVSWLALPTPTHYRSYVMLLDPAKIVKAVLGPRWVRLGKGIEYLLPDGFPQDAIVFGWELQVT